MNEVKKEPVRKSDANASLHFVWGWVVGMEPTSSADKVSLECHLQNVKDYIDAQ